MAGEALCEPQSVHFVASATLCIGPDFAAGAIMLCLPLFTRGLEINKTLTILNSLVILGLPEVWK